MRRTVVPGTRLAQARLSSSRKGGALPLPLAALAGEGGVGVSPRVILWREPPPGSHLRCDPTSPASGRGALSLPPPRFNPISSRANLLDLAFSGDTRPQV